MATEIIYLASDNFAPVHPSILDAIVQANQDDAPSYGGDKWTAHAEKLIQDAFNCQPRVLFVSTGTGSNVLALKIACRSYESVICTDIAHLNYQECGAAESLVGCKLITVKHHNGKLHVKDVRAKLKSERAFGRHSTLPRMLTITQPTEMGTVYTCEEMKALSMLCKEENLYFHMDGSRLYNALNDLNLSFQDLLAYASLDLLSLGGTKIGLMGAEALVIFNTHLQIGSDYLHKQMLQLCSKMRFVSAQFIPLFEKPLWSELASYANQKAQQLAQIIQQFPAISLIYPVETNQLFIRVPFSWIPLITEKISCYIWNKENNELRLITSWYTSDEDIEKVDLLFQKLSSQFSE